MDYLGGKSVNGNPVIFPLEDATPYHVYHKVLNAKNYGVPQNRDRVFIVGIRDDADNTFHWPKPFPLVKRLKDVLENDVDQKYYLSDKLIKGFISHKDRHEEKGTGFKWQPKNEDDIANALRANGALCPTDNSIKIGYINQDTQASKVFSEEGTSPTLSEGTHGYAQGYIKVKSATKKGIIQLNNPNHSNDRIYSYVGISPTLNTMQGGNRQPFIAIGAIRGRNPENPLSREVGLPTEQRLELNLNGTSNALTTVQKDNVVVCEQRNDEGLRFFKDGVCGTIRTIADGGDKRVIRNQTIRRLTPRECMRLMDFPDTFTWPVSNSQAYKQAGNSIVVAVLAGVISKLNL